MLSTTVIFLFISIGLASYWKTRRLIHPAVIVSATWTLLLLSYKIFDHGLYPLSDKFYWVILLWVIPFCLASLCLHNLKIPFPNWMRSETPRPSLIRFIFPVMMVLNIIYLVRLYTISDGMSFYSALNEDGVENLPLDMRLMLYLNKISIVLCTLFLLTKTNISKKWRFGFIALFLLCLLFISIKTTLFQLFFVVILYLYFSRKLSIFKLVLLTIGIFVFVGGIQIFRTQSTNGSATEFDGVRLLTIYTLSPLPAFDKVLNNEIDYKQGRSLRFFSAVAEKIGAGKSVRGIDDEDMWVTVPVPTNVYTVMFSFYVDYGYWGVSIFAILQGLLWGFLYKGIQQNIVQLTILFSVIFYMLPLQFFADYIFTFFSVFLQIIIIIHLFFTRYTFRYLVRKL